MEEEIKDSTEVTNEVMDDTTVLDAPTDEVLDSEEVEDLDNPKINKNLIVGGVTALGTTGVVVFIKHKLNHKHGKVDIFDRVGSGFRGFKNGFKYATIKKPCTIPEDTSKDCNDSEKEK